MRKGLSHRGRGVALPDASPHFKIALRSRIDEREFIHGL